MPSNDHAASSGAKTILLAFGVFFVFYVLFFWPVTLTGKIFLSDGQHAAFFSPLHLWSDDLGGGWPIAADPLQMMFSPLRLLCKNLPHGFNIYIVLTYTLSSFCMFLYVHSLTRSRLAGYTAGIVMGLGGFMTSHLSHTSMISVVAWTPLLLLALDKIRGRFSPGWLALGALTIGVMLVSGHPQLAAYGFLVCAAYALVGGLCDKTKDRRYWLAFPAMFILGAGLAAFQLLPTIELTRESLRNHYSYSEFITYSLPPKQLISLLFPFLFGSHQGLFFGNDYVGRWGFVEVTGYAGLCATWLAAITMFARREWRSAFWGCVALVAILLALGDAVPPLARLVYHLPFLGKFRVPGRHVFEYDLAVAILAGLAIPLLADRNLSRKIAHALSAGLALAMIVLVGYAAHVQATLAGSVTPGLLAGMLRALLTPAVLLPTLTGCALLVFFLVYPRVTSATHATWALLGLITLDMICFGSFQEWRLSRAEPPTVWHEAQTKAYGKEAARQGQKLLSYKGTQFPADSMRYLHIPALSWYGPLILKRYNETTGLNVFNILDPGSVSQDHCGLDIYGCRYLFVEHPGSIERLGLTWADAPLTLTLGDGCGQRHAGSHTFGLAKPFAADTLGIVSHLSCSTDLETGAPVCEVMLYGAHGRHATLTLEAGRDTAEWAAGLPDVKVRMHHAMATVFDSTPYTVPGGVSGLRHSYFTKLTFPAMDVTAIEIRSRDGVDISIDRLTLRNAKTGASHPLTQDEGRFSHSRWKLLDTADGVSVYENRKVMPPVWLVGSAIAVTPDEALRAIRKGILPNGSPFRPWQQVLTEQEIPLAATTSGGSAKVLEHDDSVWKIQTEAPGPRILVIAQNAYPGWRATIDGETAPILRINHSQQGLLVAAGNHDIVLRYRPTSFFVGTGIATCSLLILLALALRRPRPAKGHKPDHA